MPGLDRASMRRLNKNNIRLLRRRGIMDCRVKARQ
jgi:hypothetical protein